MILTLPWPDTILSPNDMSHWSKKMAMKKSFREIGFFNAKVNMIKFGDGNISLSIVFHPPTKRNYDLDNLLNRCKSMLDGLSEGWGINDKRFRPITIDFGDVVKSGKVVLTVE